MFRDDDSGGGGEPYIPRQPEFNIQMTDNIFVDVNVRFFTIEAMNVPSKAVFTIDMHPGGVDVNVTDCFIAPHPSTLTFFGRLRMAFRYILPKKIHGLHHHRASSGEIN